MGGYIGAKVGKLVTTAANVSGDATIGGNLTVKGTTITVDSATAQTVDLGDGDKIRLGDGDDLQIYHDGSHSYINDTGTGNLKIGATNLHLMNGALNEYYFAANENGGAFLYYDNAVTFATTSTGVDVTGTANVDVLTQTNGAGTLTLKDLGGSSSEIEASGTLHIDFQGSNFEINTNDTARFNISSNGDISFYEDTGTTPKLFWDASAESLRLGTYNGGGTPSGSLFVDSNSNNHAIHIEETGGGSESWQIGVDTDGDLGFYNSTSTTASVTFDDSGNLLVGQTSASASDDGIYLDNSGFMSVSRSRPTANTSVVAQFNRKTTDGDILQFYKDGSEVGSIGTDATTTSSNSLTIDSGSNGVVTVDGLLKFINTKHSGTPRLQPVSDNAIDLGNSSFRYDDIFATNGTIQTSDQNEKQDIASLTSAEITAATAISKLFKTYKWKDKVAAKGDDARTHTGVVAQQVQTAMSDAGLDASKYAFWCSDTWWETQTEVAAVEAVEAQDAVYDEEGNLVTEVVEAVEAQDAYTRTDTYDTQEEAPEGATEHTRMGVRYPELLAFVGAATEQRLTSIEARLDALEG